MDIGDLVVFKAIAKEQSVTKAAHSLNYVQSNVTMRLKRLEKELGTPLFHRNARGMTLTSSGKTLVGYADRLLSLMTEAKQAMQGDEPRGPLTIGAIETAAAVRLPAYLTSFMRRFPAVDLTFLSGTTESLIQDVLHHRVDGAFVTGPVDHPEIDTFLFCEEELVLISDQEHSPLESFQDIHARTLVTLQAGCMFRRRVEQWLAAEGIYPKKHVEFSTLEGLIGCVKSGLGVALFARAYIEHAARGEGVHYYEIPDAFSHVSTLFICRKDEHRSKALVEWIAAIEQKKEC
ncbi:LysR family transcriptional regulator [Domibacillus enclensis]|uniref:LysR family transcriptional regulator n=1 Tax=Domibacillus enclensis TaxID=1017273 RepID=A0A1N6Y546_9BACI|nr:LysR family transcriptional regulator [Domibacillus enclensis]OXS77520.1 LysR family transcriptional regulator [Domibacillus enclensis]SIR09708.1 transcriptional regulator, LysR family [Domibacillus enclensis]